MGSVLDSNVKNLIKNYRTNFINKIYSDENNDTDIIMDLFNISPKLKRENRQYWGRELGMFWQLLVIELFKNTNVNYSDALRFGRDEPCDLVVGTDAIDTKYRIGSGDSGTLKKFEQYGKLLREEGYRPVLLFVREDNLPAAISKCKAGGWTILTGQDTFNYIRNGTGIDIISYLKSFNNTYYIDR